MVREGFEVKLRQYGQPLVCTFSTKSQKKEDLNFQKWSERPWPHEGSKSGYVSILTSKCVRTPAPTFGSSDKRAYTALLHLTSISTSKSGPALVCLVHFDFEMCFAPQRRAIFHLSSGQLAPAALASLLFDPPEPQIIGKTECFATFLPFRASASSFF